MIELIDSHCHLEVFFKEGKLDAIIRKAETQGVGRMITVGTRIEDWPIYRTLAMDYREKVFYTVGLHPCHVDENWAQAIEQIRSFFTEDCPPRAIGEIGLDYFHLPKEPKAIERVKYLQGRAFLEQLSLGKYLRCPIIIHSRNAFKECVEMIDQSGVDWNKVVFHCFAEGSEEISLLNERGGRGSFTGIVTYKKAENVREALLRQGIESLMLETDAPYLAPEPFRSKQNEPAYVCEIAKTCARLFGKELEFLSKQLTANTLSFFDL